MLNSVKTNASVYTCNQNSVSTFFLRSNHTLPNLPCTQTTFFTSFLFCIWFISRLIHFISPRYSNSVKEAITKFFSWRIPVFSEPDNNDLKNTVFNLYFYIYLNVLRIFTYRLLHVLRNLSESEDIDSLICRAWIGKRNTRLVFNLGSIVSPSNYDIWKEISISVCSTPLPLLHSWKCSIGAVCFELFILTRNNRFKRPPVTAATNHNRKKEKTKLKSKIRYSAPHSYP